MSDLGSVADYVIDDAQLETVAAKAMVSSFFMGNLRLGLITQMVSPMRQQEIAEIT